MMVSYRNTFDNKNITFCDHGVQSAPLDNGNLYSRHFHDEYEMLLILKGDAHYNVDGHRYALRPYDLVLIPPSTYHFLIPVSNADYESYVLNARFDPAHKERLERLFCHPYVINVADDAILRKKFELLDIYREKFSARDFKEAADHLLYEIVIWLSYKTRDDGGEMRTADGNTLIASITRYISEHLEEDVCADVIAKSLNFSRSYIQNAFSETMGIGLKQYINQKKIYAAHSDIEEGMTARAAAEKYAYREYSSFFRQYKKVFGASPANHERLDRPQ